MTTLSGEEPLYLKPREAALRVGWKWHRLVPSRIRIRRSTRLPVMRLSARLQMQPQSSEPDRNSLSRRLESLTNTLKNQRARPSSGSQQPVQREVSHACVVGSW
jgi:hypothetical protein